MKRLLLYIAYVFIFLFSISQAMAVSGWISIDTDTYTTDAESWTGGSRDATTQTYNTTGDFSTVRKNFGLTSASYELINITVQVPFFTDDANDIKFFIYGTASDNDYLLFDGTKASQSWKAVVDGGGFGTGSCGSEVWVDGDYVTLIINKTSREWKTYHNSKLCHTVTSAALAGSDNFEINAAGSHPMSIDNVAVSYWGPISSCTYPGSGDWTIVKSDNCVITTDVDLLSNRLIFDGSGSGSTVIKSRLTNVTGISWSGTPIVYLWWSAVIRRLA